MKESITKFDLEAAFKALDEIDVPVVKEGIKANKPALTEIFKTKTKFESLFEEYYDIGSSEGLNDAKDAREAEIAKAKLARIEKIVDLDAETSEDLLTSYVGKLIIQCPQCMTLFYKNPEDVEESEDDEDTVNVSEICQHCGNSSGYVLIGKVGEATPEEMDNFDTDDMDLEIEDDLEAEEPVDDEATEDEDTLEDDDLDLSLDDIDMEEEEIPEDEDEVKEESFFTSHEGSTLVEGLTEDADNLDVSAEDFEKLISSPEFKKPISDSEVRAMLDSENDAESTTESLVEAIFDIYYGNHARLTEGAGAETMNIIKDILSSLNKEDSNNWANTVTEVVSAVPEDNADELFDIIKKRFENTKINNADKEKILNAAGKDPKNYDGMDTIGKIFTMLDPSTFEADELKKCLIITLGIVAAIEPTPIVEVITTIVSALPAEAVKKIITIISKLSTPGVLVDFVKKYLANKDISEDLENSEQEQLEEGIFDKLKDKFSGMVDKVTDRLKSREDKADWILANAKEDYAEIKLNDEGKIIPDESNRRFKNFIVIGYKDKFTTGKEILVAPKYDDTSLEVGMNRPEVKTDYLSADKVAKGWSMRQGNGPAFIYMAKDANDENAVYLCQYFKGELAYDQLEHYFEVVKKDLKGAQLTAEGGMDQSNYKETPASEVKQGMKVQLDDEDAEITKVSQSRIGKNSLAIELKLADGSTEVINVNANTNLNILKEAIKVEKVNNFDGVEELHEASMEALIANTLIESYKNVAGFRLKECSYLDEKLSISGTIHFTSGKTRNTTYTFTEALVSDNKVEMQGSNKKLKADRQFKLSGRVYNKTFIAESLK